jgi:hypothetical protein
MLPGARVEAVKARNILPPGEVFLLARAIGDAARRLTGC